jgi:hypothetical protein
VSTLVIDLELFEKTRDEADVASVITSEQISVR